MWMNPSRCPSRLQWPKTLFNHWERTVGAVVAISVIVGMVIAFEARYARSDEFQDHRTNSRIEFTEIYIDEAQEKLTSLVVIPEADRMEWQQKEILRLRVLITKYERVLQRLDM